MTKITILPDLGLSPKKKFLKNLNVAFVDGNIPWLKENISDNIIWEIVGNQTLHGHTAFFHELENMKIDPIQELTIHQILTQGKGGVVNGQMTLKSGQTYRFSDYYLFDRAKNGRIQSITSYVIKTS